MAYGISANVHINQEGAHALHPDEAELVSMFKHMYADYWETKTSGKPFSESSQGNWWKIDYRTNRLNNGEPNINKEVYFKNPRTGQFVRVSDEIDSQDGTLDWALEKTRNRLEKPAFLASAYEAHERYGGDIQRLIESIQAASVSLKESDNPNTAGSVGRRLIESLDPSLHSTQNVEFVNWQITSPEIENENLSTAELNQARATNAELILPPADSGALRHETETIESLTVEESTPRVVQTPNGRIVFGDETGRRP